MSEDLKELVEAVKNAADIVEIVGSVVDLKRQGKDYFAICPFHNDSDPSFSVVPAKKICHCFGCGETWDVISFWMKHKGIRFYQALQEIGEKAGVPVKGGWRNTEYKKYPKQKSGATWTPETHNLPPEQWSEKAFKLVLWANERLYSKPAAMRYLIKIRGLSIKTISAYGLGWCEGRKGEDLYRDRESWGLPAEINDKGRKRALWIPAGVVMPYFIGSSVVKINIRRPDPLKTFPHMRYYFLPGGSTVTTVLNPEARAFVIVESDLDAFLIVQEAGDLVGVVCLRMAHAKPDRYAYDILRNSLYILNSLDHDDAGAKAARWWQKEFPDQRLWPSRTGKDPGEAWKEGKDIREWIKAGLPKGLK
jgi:hypothetical protein